MFVIMIWKIISSHQALPARCFGVIERRAHLIDQATGTCGGFIRVFPLADQLGRLVKFQFLKDRCAPDRPIHPLGREGKQEVALQAWPQDTGIEKRSEHIVILSLRSALATATRDSAPRLAQLLEHRIEGFLVVKVDSSGVECGVLCGPPLFPVSKEITKEDPTMSSHTLEGDLAFIEQLDQRWPAHTQKVRSLLGRNRLRKRGHGDSEPLLESFDYMTQEAIELRGKLDLITWGGSGQKIAWSGSASA